MPYIPDTDECNELNPSLCGGKMTPTMDFTYECTGCVRRPYGDCLDEMLVPEVCIPECEVEPLSCFTFAFNPLPPIEGDQYDLMVTIVNTCDIGFDHSTLYHEGFKNVSGDAEVDVDIYGLTPGTRYYSNVYFIATEEDIERGYKDVTYTLTATAEDDITASDTVTYRYNLT